MPALITHHLFGEEAVSLLPEGIVSNQEEMLSFLLGNQGPDPLFACFSTRPDVARACHQLAHAMHRSQVTEALLALRDAVSHLPERDKTIGRAFALGMLGHYLLDSTAHPFVYAQQNAICEAGVGLENAGGDVHAVIESDIDSWLLWAYRHQTVSEHPVSLNLARTGRIERVAGAMVAQVSWQVFGLSIPANAYGGAVGDYELVYRVIDDGSGLRTDAIALVERIFRSHSRAQALAHHDTTSDACAAANLSHHEWHDPYTGAPSSESFPDLFFSALDRWEAMAESYVKGDARALRAVTGKRNYDGEPTSE